MKNTIGLKTSSLLIGLIAVWGAAGCATPGGAQYSSPQDWAAKSMQGALLPLATEAGTWSAPKTFTTPTGALEVQSKFVKQHGTTCHFNVKFTNNGTGNVDQQFTLAKVSTAEVYGHRLTRVKVPAGKALWWEMERRECAPTFGTSTDMTKCASCQPVLVYFMPK